MSTQPMFKPNGKDFDVSPAGVVFVAVNVVYGDLRDSTAETLRLSTLLLDQVLTAARTAGYTQCDILRTLACKGVNRRVMVMVQAACDAVGTDALNEIIDRLDGQEVAAT